MQSLENVNFWLRFIVFLCHIVSIKVIEVDPKKTDAVKSYPRPINPWNIKSFLVKRLLWKVCQEKSLELPIL